MVCTDLYSVLQYWTSVFSQPQCCILRDLSRWGILLPVAEMTQCGECTGSKYSAETRQITVCRCKCLCRCVCVTGGAPCRQVISAEGEHNASRALKEAADVISQSPAALQLRYLQTLSQISAEKNSTIIFPIPIEMMKGFMK